MRNTLFLIVTLLPMYSMANSFDLPTVHSIKMETNVKYLLMIKLFRSMTVSMNLLPI